MERRTIDKLYEEFLDSLETEDRNVFKLHEMEFKGENYPLCEHSLKDMFEKITKNGDNNRKKFMAIASMFFVLFEIYGK